MLAYLSVLISCSVVFVQYLKAQEDPVMMRVLREIENMLAQGRLDLPLTLCFAVTRGDDLLLHQLLRRGLDPNESDSNGQTALVRNSCALALNNPCSFSPEVINACSDSSLCFPYLVK